MKEQFVTYEIALKLKELGFNEPCIAYYVVNKDKFIYNINKVLNYSTGKGNFLGEKCYSAPLWQQATDFVFKKLEFYYPTLYLELYSDYSGYWLARRDIYQGSVLCEKLEVEFNDKKDMILKAIELCQKEK